MSNKTLIVLAGIVVILLVVLFGNELLKAIGITNESRERVFSTSLTADSVNEISIKKPQSSEIKLLKTQSGWTVNGLEGSVDIEVFVENLADLTISSLVSKSEEKFELFEVTEDTATLLTLLQTDGIEHSILIGKTASTPNSFYIRMPGELTVYTVYGSLRSKILQEVDDWRERVLFQLDEDLVASIDVVNGNNSYAMLKNSETAWELRYRNISTLMSDSAKNRFFTTLLRLEAQGFNVDATPASIQSSADASITISGGSEAEAYKMWFKKQDTEWHVSTSNSEYVYTFAEHAFQYILVDPATMSVDS